MEKTHPFAQGFAEKWPEGIRHINKITTIGDRHYIKGLGGPLGKENIAIGVAGRTNQKDEGRIAAVTLCKILAESQIPLVERFKARIENIAEKYDVAVHSTRIVALMPTSDLFSPTIEVELSEFDDALMSNIKLKRVDHENMPLARGSLGAMTIGSFTRWCEEQSNLRKIRNKTGLLIDPILKRFLTEKELEDIVTHLRKDPVNTENLVRGYWLDEDLQKRNVNTPENVKSIHIRKGHIGSRIELSEGVVWESKYKNNNWCMIEIRKPVPESILQKAMGKPLTDIISHPFFEKTWIIEKIETGLFLSKKIYISCKPVPALTSPIE